MVNLGELLGDTAAKALPLYMDALDAEEYTLLVTLTALMAYPHGMSKWKMYDVSHEFHALHAVAMDRMKRKR